MTCHAKYWPQGITPRVLGYKDNLHAYKSITELMSAQEKVTLGVYINEVHCNSRYIFCYLNILQMSYLYEVMQ